eukprot:COSAG05_NODE_1546_length_4588_cov_3.851637_1_plen_50_part_00
MRALPSRSPSSPAARGGSCAGRYDDAESENHGTEEIAEENADLADRERS